jgi:hypothetical protein
METYAYALVTWHLDSDVVIETEEIVERLNRLGQQGWRVVDVATPSNSNGRRVVWTLERRGTPADPQGERP